MRAALAGAIALAVISAPAASASTAQISQGFYSPDTGCDKYSMCAYTYLAVTGAPGEVNVLWVTGGDAPGTVMVHDSVSPVTAGPGCTAMDPTTASCLPGDQGVRVSAGDMDDSILLGFGMAANGGPGSDKITGSLEDDRLDGGGGGVDTLDGYVGQDVLSDGDTAGAVDDDALDGGLGVDRVDYSSRTAPVVVNLGGKLPKGTPAGERDRVVNVEEATGTDGEDVLVAGRARTLLNGGRGDDTLIGGPDADRVWGGLGNDRLIGHGGIDFMRGGSGDDRLSGEAGDDKLRGNSGNDRIFGGTGGDQLLAQRGDDRVFGGRGNDRISGGPGRDRMAGEAGADLFRAREGERDVVGGGAGRDRAKVDARLDRVRRVERLF